MGDWMNTCICIVFCQVNKGAGAGLNSELWRDRDTLALFWRLRRCNERLRFRNECYTAVFCCCCRNRIGLSVGHCSQLARPMPTRLSSARQNTKLRKSNVMMQACFSNKISNRGSWSSPGAISPSTHCMSAMIRNPQINTFIHNCQFRNMSFPWRRPAHLGLGVFGPCLHGLCNWFCIMREIHAIHGILYTDLK